MVFRQIKEIYNSAFKLYAQAFVEQNGKTDLATKFIRGIAPVVIAGYFYIQHRRQIPDLDPDILVYYDVQVDKQNTPNFSEQKLRQLQQYSVLKQRTNRK